MNTERILAACDHTLLAVGCTWDDIKKICDDGMAFSTASVCIPAAYVREAKAYVGDRLKICTVTGFPTGYSTTATKVFETRDAVENGADEIDTVLNVGFLKSGRYDELLDELKAIRAACEGKVYKVIIEACLLTEEEKLKACELVSLSGADFIKTSTGFSTGGATFADVELMVKNVKPGVLVKAAGGISSLEDAERFLDLGASRLGTSRVVKILKNEKAEGKY